MQWSLNQPSEVRIAGAPGLTLTIGSDAPEPGFTIAYRMETQARPEDFQSTLLGLLCHVLVEQLTLPGRMEALQSLVDIREFHREDPEVPPVRILAPELAHARVTATKEREIPPLGRD